MDGFTEALIKDYQREQGNYTYLLAQKDEKIAELEKRVAWLEKTLKYLQDEGYRNGRGN